VLRIYGMRRSGNHAIINWLQRNAPGGASVFLNNCHPRRDPVASHRSLEVFAEGAPVSLPKDASVQEKLDLGGPEPLLLVSYEDTMPPAPGKPFAPLYASAPETVVLIYRGFLNWSASLLRKILGNDGYGPIARARIMMTAFSGYASALDRVAEAGKRGFVAICYDQWHASESYRASILSALGVPARDNTRGAVQRYGGGSSFQGKAAAPDALETDRRAAQMAESDEYKALLWIAAHDAGFMERLATHFSDDAAHLLGLAETAQLRINLPGEVSA
jgi:hypothetical protein